MTEDDLVNSYKIPAYPAPRRHPWRLWAFFCLFPMGLMGSGLIAWVVEAAIPWWVPSSGIVGGVVLSAIVNRTGYRFWLPKWNRLSGLRFLGVYMSYRILTDVMARSTIPHEAHHQLFDVGVLLSIMFGFILAVLLWSIRPSESGIAA